MKCYPTGRRAGTLSDVSGGLRSEEGFLEVWDVCLVYEVKEDLRLNFRHRLLA